MTDREELESIAKQAAETAVRGHGENIRKHVDAGICTALTRLGLDVAHPLEQQKDQQFLRDVRKSARSVKSKLLLTVVGAICLGAIGLVLAKLGAWFD